MDPIVRLGWWRQQWFVAQLVLAFGTIISAPATLAQTLPEVLEMAYRNSAQIQAARTQLMIAGDEIIRAEAGLAPTFGIESQIQHRENNQTRSQPGHNSSLMTGGVYLTGRILLYDGGVQRLAIGQSGLRLGIAESQLESTIHQVLLDAIVAYHEVIKAEGFLSLARNSLAVLEEEMEAARNRFRLGAIARTDISFVESRLATARGDVQLREGELEIAREQFNFVVGSDPGRLATESSFPTLPKSLDAAIEMAGGSSPAIAIARTEVEIAEADHERAERGLKTPRITLGGRTGAESQFKSRGNTTRTGTIDITGNFTLSNGGAGQATVRQAAAAINRTRMILRHQSNIVRQRVTNAWVRIDIARSDVATAREQVKHTELAFNGTRAEAVLGARSTLDVLDAEQDYLQALTNQITAENNQAIAIYRLFGEIGILTPDFLGLDVDSDSAAR